MAAPTETPRPYHHGGLRDALLRRAAEVLAADGADALTLRGIARDVGVSHAAPRRHFADRQALLDALAEEGFARLGRELRAAVGGGQDDARTFVDRFVALARAYVGFAVRDPELLDLMFAGKHRPGASDALVAAGREAFAAPIALFEEGQASGDVVAGDAERLGTAGWAGIHGLATMTSSGLVAVEDLPDLLPVVVERLVLGLRPRDR